jgi:hypothetical protein
MAETGQGRDCFGLFGENRITIRKLPRRAASSGSALSLAERNFCRGILQGCRGVRRDRFCLFGYLYPPPRRGLEAKATIKTGRIAGGAR